jgi:hypothetical protein
MNIAADAIDRRRFIESLIVPAYEQGCARLLLSAGLPLRIYGRGWNTLDEFVAISAGALTTNQALLTAAASAAALVYIWPTRYTHPIDAMGRPIVHRPGRRRESFIREAKLALAGSIAKSQPAISSPANVMLRLLGTQH